MRLLRIPALAALVVAVMYLVTACGGSGSNSSSSLSGVNIFATDDISTKYSHVWVTILKVDLSNSSGSVNAYTSTTGQQIDVASLHGSGAANVFAFLATASVPAGTYTSAKITLSPTVTLVPVGSTTAITKTFSNLDTAGDKELTVNFSPNKVVSNGTSLVFDFNLAQWTDDSTTVSGVINDGPSTGLNNPSNQKPSDSLGTVSGLTGTAPTQSFTVSRGDDHCSVTVTTTASTTISNSDGSANPVLANGQTVDVQGTFSTTTNSLAATSIQIQVGTASSPDSFSLASGTLASYTSGTSFSLTIGQARHFTPTGTTVTVATTTITKLFGFRGENLSSTQFFALLPSATWILAEGSYDSGSNTITADSICLQGAQSSDPNGINVRGTAASGSTATSISLTLEEEDGLSLAPGTVITVVPATTVAYYDSTGASVGAATFTTDLATAASVSAEGTFNSTTSTLTATKIRIWAGSNEWNNIQVTGTTSSFGTDGSFTLALSDWSDGPFSSGLAIAVKVTSSTTYTLVTGSATMAAFDASEVNQKFTVVGTVNSDGTITATALTTVHGP